MNEHNKTFFDRVYSVVAKIPKGKVMTYQGVARRAGNKNAVRAVGNAMHKNTHWPRVPCHRVISSSGTLGNWSGRGGIAKKKRLLLAEHIVFRDGSIDTACILR